MRPKPINRRSALGRIGKLAGALLLGAGMRRAKANERANFLGTMHIRANGQEKQAIEEKAISTRGRSAKSVIEGYPEVANKELTLFKYRGTSGELRDWMYERSEHDSGAYIQDPNEVKSITHTHLLKSANQNMSKEYKLKRLMYLSPKDFHIYLKHLEEGRVTKPIVMHLATISETGKVIGYTSTLFGKKFLELYSKKEKGLIETLQRIRNIEEQELESTKGIDEYISLIQKLKNYGVRMKFTRIKG